MRSIWMTAATLLLICAATQVATAGYWEDFNDANAGMNGWSGDNAYYSATGGIGNSGFKAGWRDTFAPYHVPSDAPAASTMLGNMQGRFGQTITFDYWVKDLAGSYTAQPQFYVFSPNGNIWGLPIGPLDMRDWVNVKFTIKTNWTDDEARAAGWYNDPWKGGTFSAVWDNVTYYNFLTGSGSGRVETGIDNVSVTPEPASLLLLSAAAALCLRRRRV